MSQPKSCLVCAHLPSCSTPALHAHHLPASSKSPVTSMPPAPPALTSSHLSWLRSELGPDHPHGTAALQPSLHIRPPRRLWQVREGFSLKLFQTPGMSVARACHLSLPVCCSGGHVPNGVWVSPLESGCPHPTSCQSLISPCGHVSPSTLGAVLCSVPSALTCGDRLGCEVSPGRLRYTHRSDATGSCCRWARPMGDIFTFKEILASLTQALDSSLKHETHNSRIVLLCP